MQLSTLTSREAFFKKVENAIEKKKDGEGFTKQELAEHFGYTDGATVSKWCKLHPELRKYCVYLPTNDGRQRTVVFVNPKYKKYLLDNRKTTKATEVY